MKGKTKGIHNSNLLEAQNYFIKLLKAKMDNHVNQTHSFYNLVFSILELG